MSDSKYLFIVSMNVKSEYENLFNEVYDDEHVPYLLEVPGVNKVTRGKGEPFQFSIAGETKNMDAPHQKFVALYEINFTKTPVRVVIDEALELAKQFSTQDSPKFINGILGKYVEKKCSPGSSKKSER